MIQKAADFVYKYFLFFLPISPDGRPNHPWDYIAHFLVSFAIVCVIFFALKVFKVNSGIALFVSLVILLVIALMKEVSDLRMGKTDIGHDMLANFLGMGAALLLIFLTTKFAN